MRKKIFITIYLILEFCLYLTFLIIDFASLGDSTIIKYISIIGILLFEMTLLILRKQNDLRMEGIICTLYADTFLLLLDSYYNIGLIFFNLTQFFYFLYIRNNNLKIKNIIIISCFILFFFIVGIIINQQDVCLSISYISIFIFNIITLMIKKDKTKVDKIFLLGLILFILCDNNVFLFNLGNYISLPKYIYQLFIFLGQNMMWFFYLPSQVIISISILKKEK